MTKTEGVVFKPIPELTRRSLIDRLWEFYQKLGWDKERQIFNRFLVEMHIDDFDEFVYQEAYHFLDILKEEGLKNYSSGTFKDIERLMRIWWYDRGPSAGGSTPGFVELYPGWVREL